VRPAVLVLVLLSSCKDDDDLTPELGARCQDSAMCASLCLPPSETVPEGLCTRACESDDDCPATAACAPAVGVQVCLFACRDDRDCDLLEAGSEGGRWSCQDIERSGSAGTDGGSVLVCLGE
jgi:hypothetical protein